MREGMGLVRRAGAFLLLAALAACTPSADLRATPTTVAVSPTPIASPVANGVSMPTRVPAAQAWRLVRRSVPASALVIRPTWLPPALAVVDPTVSYAYATGEERAGYRYGVGYVTGTTTIVFAAGAVNSGPPKATETTTIRGMSAQVTSTDTWPNLQVAWTERGNLFTVQANGVSKDELLRVAAELQEEL
jgi:hypothetical protein